MITDFINKKINYLLNFFNRYSINYFTFHSRPKYSKDVSDKFIDSPAFENSKSSIAIVIQGPLLTDGDFTLETIKLYIKNFPKHKLILSTWSDSDSMPIEAIKKLGIEVVMNEKPKNGGIANINFQIVSAAGGINRAKEMGCEYALKTRTDQRIYSSQAISLCYLFLKKFPITGEYNQNERIVAFNLNTFKYRPYSISDMINFGHINDMLKYWCVEQDARTQEELIETNTLLDWSKQNLAEVYFVTSFLKNINKKMFWTLEDSWKVMSENFCILNINEIDLYWRKYTNKEFRHQDYKTLNSSQFNFSDWLIYQDHFPENIPEKIIVSKQNNLN